MDVLAEWILDTDDCPDRDSARHSANHASRPCARAGYDGRHGARNSYNKDRFADPIPIRDPGTDLRVCILLRVMGELGRICNVT